MIDRTDEQALTILLRLARGAVEASAGPGCQSGDPWLDAFARWGLPPPDPEPLNIAGVSIALAWRSHLAAAVAAALPEEVLAALHDQAFTVVILPPEPGPEPPRDLADALMGVDA